MEQCVGITQLQAIILLRKRWPERLQPHYAARLRAGACGSLINLQTARGVVVQHNMEGNMADPELQIQKMARIFEAFDSNRDGALSKARLSILAMSGWLYHQIHAVDCGV